MKTCHICNKKIKNKDVMYGGRGVVCSVECFREAVKTYTPTNTHSSCKGI